MFCYAENRRDTAMRHDWILDVLTDLRSYAAQNGLMALSLKAEETLRVARAEIAAAARDDRPRRDSG